MTRARKWGRYFRYFILAVILLLMLKLGAGIFMNASRIESVTVNLLPGVTEQRDFAIPGIKQALPDYRLQVRAQGAWVDCGTFENTSIKNGITWTVSEVVAESLFNEIKLLEARPGFDEVLAQVQVNDGKIVDESYEFEYASTYSMGAGVAVIGRENSTPLIIIAISFLIVLLIKAIDISKRRKRKKDDSPSLASDVLASAGGSGTIDGEVLGEAAEAVGDVVEGITEVTGGILEAIGEFFGGLLGGL